MVPRQAAEPPHHPGDQEQLEGVLDPMSGAFLSAHSDNPNGDLNVCDQTVPVFDGMQRFDLVLTPKRAVRCSRIDTGRLCGPRGDLRA